MRQTFQLGQTVYVKGYGPYQKAVVAEPDKTKRAYGYSIRGDRFIHYVGVHYVKPDGTVQVDRVSDVLNNRRMILDEAAFAELQHGKQIANRRGLMAECDKFERDFALYHEQARIIAAALNVGEDARFDRAAVAEEIEKLAYYLRGVFSLRSDWGRMNHADVRKLRADNAEAARVAVEELRAMGVEP